MQTEANIRQLLARAKEVCDHSGRRGFKPPPEMIGLMLGLEWALGQHPASMENLVQDLNTAWETIQHLRRVGESRNQ